MGGFLPSVVPRCAPVCISGAGPGRPGPSVQCPPGAKGPAQEAAQRERASGARGHPRRPHRGRRSPNWPAGGAGAADFPTGAGAQQVRDLEGLGWVSASCVGGACVLKTLLVL